MQCPYWDTAGGSANDKAANLYNAFWVTTIRNDTPKHLVLLMDCNQVFKSIYSHRKKAECIIYYLTQSLAFSGFHFHFSGRAPFLL